VLAGAAGLAGAAPRVAAQRPDVAPRLAATLDRDPAHPIWLFARPGVPLDRVTAFVVARGGTVRRTSRWLHAVSVVLPQGSLDAVRANTDLARVQPVTRFRRPTEPTPPSADFAPALGPLAAADDSGYGPSAMPLRRLNLFPLARAGVRGAGVRIAVLDSGFETELPAFAGATVVAQYDFVFNDSIVRNEAADVSTASQHGTSVWSLLAAQVPDTLIGIAPDAAYLLAKTEDVRSETQLEEDNFVAALEWADSLGAHIVTASIGYLGFDDGSGYLPSQLNGDIAVTTVAADMAAARGIVVVTSAGNDGPAPQTLSTPADGDSVLAIAAEDSLGAVAAFSSRGPTADGRVKPDFSGPGVAVWRAIPLAGATSYGRGNGTSFAAPLVAGAAALFLELHPGAGPITVRDAFRRTADNRNAPNNARGYGLVDTHRAAVFSGGVTLVEPGSILSAVTPRFTWTAGAVPAFARPVTYHLVVSLGDGTTLLDTNTTDTTVTLIVPQPGGIPLRWALSALSADLATDTVSADSARTTPAWVALQTFNEPDGVTIREFRPEFRWASPGVASPPGPFRYDLEIFRADNTQVEISVEDLEGNSFIPDIDLERNTPYRWRVTAKLGADEETVESRATFVIADDSAPAVTQLFQNFPNPFPNPSTGLTTTCFWFDLSVEGVVELSILDLRGHVVRRLIPAPDQSQFFRPGRFGRPLGAGRCDPRYEWNGTAANDARVPAGVYLAKLDTAAGTFFRRVVFLGGQ
jgi:hypothetical protein